MSYIWGDIRPRIPKSTLYLPKVSGGLGIPTFSTYYYAAQLAHLPTYHATKETPMWVAVKSVDCDPIFVANMLWLHPADRTSILNPITKHSLSIWDKFRTIRNLQSAHNPLLSFLRNPVFYPAENLLVHLLPGLLPISLDCTTWSLTMLYIHLPPYVKPTDS